VLHHQAKQRVDRIQRGLPDALDLVTMCVTGGLPLHEALERVSKELRFSNEDVAIEFEIIRRHADAHKMASALRHFAHRIDAPDVSALAALVTQTERLGTHVSTAICDYADSVRRAHRQFAEERANKTSIKMLFPVVLCLAPPIYILLCGPPVLKLRSFLIEERRPGGILAQEIPGVSGRDLEASRRRVEQQLEQGID
jgi:tight adherence protein C